MKTKKPSATDIVHALIPYAGFALFLFSYNKSVGHHDFRHHFPVYFLHRFEEVLALYLYFVFNQVLRPSRLRPFIAAIPLVLAYAAYDIFYLELGRVFHFHDLSGIPELFDVLPPATLTVASVIGLIIAATMILNLRLVPLKALMLVLPLCLLLILVVFLPTKFMDMFKNISVWSDALNVKRSGRLAMTLYYEASGIKARAELADFSDQSAINLDSQRLGDYIKSRCRRPNIHIIVLESFIDPTLFDNARYSENPLSKEYLTLFDQKASLSISPVFGGGTAQPEFEILCATPALHKIASIEFNAFTGAPVECMPRILGKAGYETIATNGYKPNFFNAYKAYKGLGFKEIHSSREYAPLSQTYLVRGDVGNEKYIFDEDLYTQNLQFVSRRIAAKPGTPLLNYVLTAYGHHPFELDELKRTPKISVTSPVKSEMLLRMTNQIHYRSKALAVYVGNLIKLDPESVIIVVSDHLPPISDINDAYKTLSYMGNIDSAIYYNRLIVINKGEVIRHDTVHHYEIPKLIYQYLSDGDYCKTHSCASRDMSDYADQYMRLMYQATR